MNRERAKELLPIIEAFANGEEVEYRWSEVPQWADCGEVGPGFEDEVEYRIKPKPREFWVAPFLKANEMPSGGSDRLGQYCEVSQYGGWAGTIKVREVLD